jgi:hypothetical protein
VSTAHLCARAAVLCSPCAAVRGRFADAQNQSYLAIARSGANGQGHNFAFDDLPTGDKVADRECDTPCADLVSYKCGCADDR